MIREIGQFLNGLKRDERLIKNLLPSSIELEDRKTNELIKFMSDLSKHVIYYNDSNKAEADWEELFMTDYNILNSLIISFDLQSYLKHFYQLEIALERAVTDKDVTDALRNIFSFIFAASLKMFDITKRLLEVQYEEVFKERLKDILDKLSDAISLLREYNQQATEALKADFIEDKVFVEENFKKISHKPNIFLYGEGAGEKTGNAFKQIKDIFNTLRKNFNRIHNACLYYLEENPLIEQIYPPHLALMITFLELYGYLKTDINQLTSKHLDFYYERILGFHLLPAQADKIVLVFDPLPDAKNPVLEKGEQVFGNDYVNEDEIKFCLDNAISLSKTRIISLKTLYTFYNERIKAKNDTVTIKETQRFQTSYQNIESSSILKNGDLFDAWPVFGQALNNLNAIQRRETMADSGLLITSPILYQASGYRKYNIKLHLNHFSFSNLMNYLFTYHGTSVGDEDVKYMLMENAFSITFTTETGWIQPEAARLSVNREDESLDIFFHQESQDLPLTVYTSIHGDIKGIKWPVIKLMINNDANFNPIGYISMLEIVRISIKADVTGASHYAMQNMNGPLNNSTVFQPFGPLAPSGSYMDIINPNIFNRYLSQVGLNLNWSGLPDVSGGFETHYKAYDAGVKNNSFKITLLSSKTEREDYTKLQNQFLLFQENEDGNHEKVIKPTTGFTKDRIDVMELGFVNYPCLDSNVQLLAGELNEGTLRIALSKDKFAFGHSCFQQIFSDTAVHNSRIFTKKKNLPEQPYTPLLNNLYIDYIQETTEQLNDFSRNNEQLNTIAFFHLTPFGYEQIFPGKIRSKYSMIPGEEFENNFYIGFDQVNAGEELTILFHLEEKAFHEAAIKIEPIKWSYLHGNVWLPMNDCYLLSDTTFNLITSGIVKIIIPPDIDLENTIMPNNQYWIRVSHSGNRSINSKIKALHTNAVTATRLMNSQTKNYSQVLAGTIVEFVNPVNGVENIWQLFPSYGGKSAESKEDFYMRVSQRLRHKNRLLLAKDIEQAILENFPEILVAKCIRIEGAAAVYGRNPTLQKVVLVALNDNNETKKLTPMVSLETLCKVQAFLQPHLSPQISISIENPVYERIKVVCKVSLVSQVHIERLQYSTQLENDINEFISPWYFKGDMNYKIGKKMFVSEMLDFIKSKSYIASVQQFGLAHFSGYEEYNKDLLLTNMDDSNYVTEGFLMGSVPEAIFIPSTHHYIEVLNEDLNIKSKDKEAIGLGSLAVGEELLIGEEGILAKSAERSFKDQITYYNWTIAKK